MGARTLLFSVVLALFISAQGFAQECSASSISSKWTKNGNIVEGLPQWDVVISNNCRCPQSDVVLRCTSFSSIEPVDPAIFAVRGDYCLVNGGKPILQGHPIIFHATFREPTDFYPSSSKIQC